MDLLAGEADYSTRLRPIKTYFLPEIVSAGEPLLKNQRDEYNLWQRRFWERCIRDESNFCTHVNYIHFTQAFIGLSVKVC